MFLKSCNNVVNIYSLNIYMEFSLLASEEKSGRIHTISINRVTLFFSIVHCGHLWTNIMPCIHCLTYLHGYLFTFQLKKYIFSESRNILSEREIYFPDEGIYFPTQEIYFPNRDTYFPIQEIYFPNQEIFFPLSLSLSLSLSL